MTQDVFVRERDVPIPYPSQAEFFQNPHLFYHELRQKDPVHWLTAISPDRWLLTQYADVAQVMRDPTFARELDGTDVSTRPPDYPAHYRALAETTSKWLVFLDPPAHTQLRTLFNKTFTPKRVLDLQPRVLQIASQLLDQVLERGEMDIISDFAFHLPIIVIADVIGVPVIDRQRVKTWTQAIMQPLDINRNPETLNKGNQAVLEFTDYLRHLAMQRRNRPQDDLLTALLQISAATDDLTDEALLANCIFLMNAGHETTMYLIGNGLFSLSQHPDQLALLRREPSLIESAVEEIIRYESPSQMAYRIARADTALGGKTIRRGEAILACWAAANRDPAQFREPDRLNIQRQDIRHLAFGMGIHFCLGAALARLEAQVAFQLFAQRLSEIKLLCETPEWNHTLMVRGLKHLPVMLVAA